MISVLIAPLPQMATVLGCIPEISAERSALIARKRHPIDRMRSQIADALLVGLSSSPHTHSYSDSGQPLSRVPGEYLSASHDGQWIVAASAFEPIGMDVVDIRRVDLASARHFQAPGERARARECVSPAAERQFAATCWAAKEAYGKREGIGLALDPRKLRVDTSAVDRAVVHHSHATAPVQFAQIDTDHVLAVVSVERTELYLRFVDLPNFSVARVLA